MTADEEAGRFVRDGIPPFVEVYDRILDLVRGARPRRPPAGRGRPGRRARVPRAPGPARRSSCSRRTASWCASATACGGSRPRAEPAAFTDSFHRMLGGRARPVRRLLVGIEDGSHWSHELPAARDPGAGLGDGLRARRRAARLHAGDDGPRGGAAGADRGAGPGEARPDGLADDARGARPRAPGRADAAALADLSDLAGHRAADVDGAAAARHPGRADGGAGRGRSARSTWPRTSSTSAPSTWSSTSSATRT